MIDLGTSEIHMEFSIYRISYCSEDAANSHVFAFIATNHEDELECHAFLCPKRKTAQTATFTIAQAFNLAFKSWEAEQTGGGRSRYEREEERQASMVSNVREEETEARKTSG